MPEYFCEVLLEEIPAWMLDAARAALQAGVEKLFAETGPFAVLFPVMLSATMAAENFQRRISFGLIARASPGRNASTPQRTTAPGRALVR